MFVLTRQQIEQLCHVHGLGAVETITRPERGTVDSVYIINDQYVLRIHAERTLRFNAAQKAHALLQAADVPVPHVIAADLSGLRIPYPYMVLTHMPGRPVVDVWPDLSDAERHKIAHEAGAHLARIHSVQLSFYGALGSDQPRFNHAYEYAVDFCARYVLPATQTRLYTPQMHEQLSMLLHICRPYIQPLSPSLVHGEFDFENILVEGSTISAIIDFDWALAGDPTWDFFVEDRWEEQCVGSLRHLYEGYQTIRRFDTQHRLKVRLYKAMHYLETIATQPERRMWAVERFHRLFSGGVLPRSLGSSPP